MKTLIRNLLVPVAIAAIAAVLGWWFIQREERAAVADAVKARVSNQENTFALRIAAIDSARKVHQVALEAERMAYEQEKRESDLAELAELSHEVRLLRIDLEHKTTLAGIDKKYPPPEKPPAP